MKIFLSIIFMSFTATAMAQNVGVGESNPTEAKLHVKAADSAVLIVQNATTIGSNIKTGLFFKTGPYYSGSIGTIGTSSSHRMGFFTFGGSLPSGLVERMSILDGGNVGIGTTTPGAKLEVNGLLKLTGGSPGAGKVLTSDASGLGSWVNPSGGFTLPYVGSLASPSNYLFSLTNTETSQGDGLISSINSINDGSAISGVASNASPAGSLVAGVTASNFSTNSNGVGLRAYHAGLGSAIYANTANGIGASISSTNGYALQTKGKLQLAGNGVGTLGAEKFLKSADASGNAVWSDLLPYSISKNFGGNIPLSITNLSSFGGSVALEAYGGDVNYFVGNIATGIRSTGGRYGIESEAVGKGTYTIETAGLLGINNNSRYLESSGIIGQHNFGGIGVTGRANNNGIGLVGIGTADGKGFSNYLSIHTKGIGVFGWGQIGVEGQTDAFGDLATDIAVSGNAWNGIGGRFSSQSGYGLLVVNGNVGIGTSTPGSKMDIAGTTYYSHFYLGANEDTYIRGGKAGSKVLINDVAGQGSVGIGITNPNQYLDVNGRMRLYHRGTQTGPGAITSGLWLNNEVNGLGINDGAFMGINCSAAGSETVGYFIGGTWRFTVDRSGNGRFGGTVTASTGFTCASDFRYKKNISSLQNALENIQKINAVNYEWKREEFPEQHFSNTNQIGFIAQDLEKIYPEMVFTDEKGYKSIDYARLTPVLVEALKELKVKNDSQQNQLNDLKKEMKELKELIQKNN